MSRIPKYFHIPLLERCEAYIARQPRAKRFWFYGLAVLLTAATFSVLFAINNFFMVEVPIRGGVLTEGVIGAPRLINPLLAKTDADKDLVTLVYSGLLRATPEGLVPDLAEWYTVSEDGRMYTVRLKDQAVWHDGVPVTADDIIYTIRKTQDPAIGSIVRANWDDVQVQRVDDRTVTFELKEPYAPFINNLTVGILPKHVWKRYEKEDFLRASANMYPIGSGPYRIRKVELDENGIPEEYVLDANESFVLGTPWITEVRVRFYTNEDELIAAFRRKEVDNINSITPARVDELPRKPHILTAPLPRVFGVFLNRTQAPIFRYDEVRSALAAAVDRTQIIERTLNGYAVPIDGPLPPGSLGYTSMAPDERARQERIEEARRILKEAGWGYDAEEGVFRNGSLALEFTLATANVNELTTTAQELKRVWEEVGAKVAIEVYDKGTLERSVIRPRTYDMLLFGEIIGRDSDPYAFWHSSQRTDPGLNIALFADQEADMLLEKARVEQDSSKRAAMYHAFVRIVQEQVPAIFLYAPDFIYIVGAPVQNVDIKTVTGPNERFLGIHDWYLKTDHVWRIFAGGAES